MPAINVAKTDTFEAQRQKINEIGANLFQISQGGSDLSTGNLKLGDGTRTVPSLAFINDATLGIYKPDIETLGFVSNNKNVFEYNSKSLNVLGNLDFTKKTLISSGLVITSGGENYDPGTYSNISLFGGSGSFGTANITVTPYNGTESNYNKEYLAGTFQNVSLTGGSGSGAIYNFNVTGIIGSISSLGSGYTEGTYENVPVQNGSGQDALAQVFVGPEGTVANVTFTFNGSGYVSGDVLTFNTSDIGGTGSGFEFTVSADSGELINSFFTDKGSGYQVGDVLGLRTPITGITATAKTQITGVTATLSILSTSFTVSDATGITNGMEVSVTDTSVGQIFPGSLVTNVSGTTITLDTAPTGDGAAELIFQTPGALLELENVSSTFGYEVGDYLKVTSGPGNLAAYTLISSIDATNSVITVNKIPTAEGSVTFDVTPPWGYVNPNPWTFTIDEVGAVDAISVNGAGYGYNIGDVFSVNATDLVATIVYPVTVQPVTKIAFTSPLSNGAIVAGDVVLFDDGGNLPEALSFNVYAVESSGGGVDAIQIAEATDIVNGATFDIQRTGSTYTADTVTSSNKFFLDVGGGATYTPDFTLYVGNTYQFDLSSQSVADHPLALSIYPDGPNSPSRVQASTLLSTSNAQITVPDTTNIVSGMLVTASGTGTIPSGTTVASIVDGTTVELSALPTLAGAADLVFAGVEYTDGVTRTSNSLTIKVSDTTPSTLYYYCTVHTNMGGDDGYEASITVDPNNPKVFGSGFVGTATDIATEKNIQFNIVEGDVTLADVTSTAGTFGNLTVSNAVGASIVNATDINASTITSPFELTLSGTTVKATAPFSVGNNITLDSVNATITSTGTIKSTNGFNSADKLTIVNETISSAANTNIVLNPASNQVVKVEGTTALTIPSGSTGDRPQGNLRESGSIRFNTTTNQYEGYSDTNQSWSSLGGVRDLDGNTTILAEESVGANDNTLWFINDNINTVKFTPFYQEFVNVKKLRSVNVSAPEYNNWQPSVTVEAGQFLKHQNNIYEVVSVTGDARTGAEGEEPTDTSGNNFTNGNTTLRFYVTAVAPITIEETSEFRIDPLGFTTLVVSNELRHKGRQISSTTEDIYIKPVGTKKVVIDTSSSLVVPVGDNNSKGSPIQGSIRYNTDDAQFEGYNGAQWGGLGGVKDIDQDTKIEAETAPNSDEDILYFYNAGSNTLRLTTGELIFDTVDTLSSINGTLALEANTVSFSSLDTTLDNTSATETFLYSTKDNLDFGLSSGLNTDHLLRLTNTGDVIFNLGFGTGTDNNLTLLNSDLTTVNLKDTKITTSVISLLKGTVNLGNAVCYNKVTESSSKILVTAENTTSGDRQVSEYLVTDNGTDIFYTETNTVNTNLSENQITVEFDYDAFNNVRINVLTGNNLTAGDNLNVTVINTVTKR